MELIFGFLPLPLAVTALVVVAVGGVIVRKYVKNKAVVAVTEEVVSTIVTRDRIDRTVEAVLAKLRVDPVLADKIGDYLADVILSITQNATARALARRTADDRHELASLAMSASNGAQRSVIVTTVLEQANPLKDLITATASEDVLADPTAKVMVADKVISNLVPAVKLA